LRPAVSGKADGTVLRLGFGSGLRRCIVLYWAISFLIVAIVAGFFGFTGIAGSSIWFGKVLFFVFIILFILSLFLGGRRPTAQI
jgi:uncharacterized membrane protein YtjA (UPF0391 family)